MTIALALSGCATSNPLNCTPGWKVTGYYTPLESDYSQPAIDVQVANYANVSFKADFVKAVKMEGWGKTQHGWYLGYYDRRWHKSDQPLNALGQPLELGTVAVDSRLIDLTSTIQLPGLQTVTGIGHYVALDRGQAVKKQHIDIYTGEGIAAKRLAWRVTGVHEVCISDA